MRIFFVTQKILSISGYSVTCNPLNSFNCHHLELKLKKFVICLTIWVCPPFFLFIVEFNEFNRLAKFQSCRLTQRRVVTLQTKINQKKVRCQKIHSKVSILLMELNPKMVNIDDLLKSPSLKTIPDEKSLKFDWSHLLIP